MPFQWLQMRITEEQERRHREAEIRRRLPHALDELRESLIACLESYVAAFGADSAELQSNGDSLRIVVREPEGGNWNETAKVDITSVPALPGLQIDGGAGTFQIEVGLLPNEKVFYRDREQDQILTMEGLMRRILDRALFPKLGA